MSLGRTFSSQLCERLWQVCDVCNTLWSALLLRPQDCVHNPVLLGKNTSSPVSPSTGTCFYLWYLSSVQCASCSVCPRHLSWSSGGMLLPVGTMALLLQQPLQQDSLSQPDSSFLTIKGDKKVSQPFTVQYNRKIQEPLPVLHHSQALFRSRSLSLLQQHCSFCTRSLTLSPLTLHLLSLLLLFFPFLLGGAAEIKHSLPWLFLQALNCPNQSICFIPYTSFAHC